MQDAGYTIRKSSLPMNPAPYCCEHEAHEVKHRIVGAPPVVAPTDQFLSRTATSKWQCISNGECSYRGLLTVSD